MKWLHWNYLRQGILALIQSVMVTILLVPWLQLASSYWDFARVASLLWSISMCFFAILSVSKSKGRGKDGILFLVFSLVLSIGFALFLRLSLFVFAPLTLLLLGIAIRFSNYPKRASFTLDWGLGSLALIITASLESFLSFKVSLSAMLLFFALGIVAIILWNLKALEQEGLQPNYGDLRLSITLFVVVVAVLALSLSLVLSPQFLHRTLNGIQKAYEVVIDALMVLIVKPFAWLLSPLFEWATQLETHEMEMEVPHMNHPTGEEQAVLGEGLSAEAIKTSSFGFWVFLLIVGLFILWVLFRKLLHREEEKEGSFQTDTRESVFSGADLLADLKGTLSNLVKPLNRLRRPKWYKGDDPLLLIRSFYARFALRAIKKVTYLQSDTPLDYGEKFIENQVEDKQAVDQLIKLYNEARYGEQGDEEAVKLAKKAFEDLS